MIRDARRPIIYAGGGITSSDTGPLLVQLAEKLGWPVTTTIMGLGAFPPDHKLALDVLGMHGTRYANIAINEADLVLALGVRFDDRVTGKVSEFIKHGRIIHIDVDRAELNKNKPVTLPIWARPGRGAKAITRRRNAGRASRVAQLCRRPETAIPTRGGCRR